ncbi:MAG TPA: SgcJ/EcaC family oxidoreductase [Terricaulis sp.]|nr:SgcJ/EcaC family oxidoreductase [Terricaulis sp.]
MRNMILAALLALAPLPLSACATQSGAMIERGDVMEAARRMSERYSAAWNSGDMNQLGALYTPDARHVTLAGVFLRGRAAIVAAHRDGRHAQGVRMATRLEGARAVSNDAIVSVMIVEYVNDPRAANRIVSARLTLTLVQRGGDWLIAQAHASPADA